MKPKYLEMSAFGPYVGVTKVDFNLIGDKGLFLINGETGAGKTTIFDGIMFALYGKSSGDERTAKQLRSKYADDNTQTYVLFIFECGGKEYKIRRNPEYIRKRTRGEGFATENAAVELILPTGQAVTKIGEVDKYIKEIIGVDATQFSQICMLAQGKFRKVLTASTKERMDIFRRLFHTENYETFSTKIFEKTKELQKELDSQKDILKGLCRSIESTSPSHDEEVERIKSGNLVINDIIAILETLEKEDSESENRLKEEENKLSEEKGRIEKRIQSKKDQDKILKEIEDNKGKLNIALEDLDKAKENYEKQKSREKEKNEKIDEKFILSSLIPSYNELDNSISDLGNAKTELEKAEYLKGTDENIREDLIKKIDEIEKDNETLKDISVRVIKNEGEIEKIEKEIEKVNRVAEKKLSYEKLKGELERKQEEFEKQKGKYDEIKSLYDSMESAYFSSQAGILAEKLEENKPCPVCGSTTHPNKAVKPVSAPTEEELKSLKNRRDREHSLYEEASKEAHNANTRFNLEEEELIKEVKETFGDISINDLDNEINLKQKELKASLNDLRVKNISLRNDEERKTRNEEELESKKKDLEIIRNRINYYEKRIASFKATVDNIEAQIVEIKGKLKYGSLEELNKKIRGLELEIDDIENGIRDAQKSFEEINTKVEKLKSSIETLSGQLKKDEDILLGELETRLKELKVELIVKEKEHDDVYARLNGNREVLKKVNNSKKEIENLEERYSTISELNNVVNGKLSGKKIDLETYVQITYFDRIIQRANLRLLNMSGGQYELKRRETETMTKEQGLDLDIIDHNNNSSREANTLSGGEGFIASLALALGLSDEIQSSAGGVRLDTLFVDEGFGSLSGNYLGQVMNALNSLTEGNKLVGVISHIEELKQRIDKRIEVTKDRVNGSVINIVT